MAEPVVQYAADSKPIPPQESFPAELNVGGPSGVPRGIQILHVADWWLVGRVTDYAHEVIVEKAQIVSVVGGDTLLNMSRYAETAFADGSKCVLVLATALRINPAHVDIRIDCDPEKWEGKL